MNDRKSRTAEVSLSEAVLLWGDQTKAAEFKQLQERGVGPHPQVFLAGPPDQFDIDCRRYEKLKEELESSLIGMLVSGSLIAEGYDVRQGADRPPVEIRPDRWRTLDIDFDKSAATDRELELTGILVHAAAPPASQPVSSAAAESECRAWLMRRAEGPKRHTKREYEKLAQQRFPGLSRNGFNRAWAEVLPPHWKLAGRP